MGTVPTVAFSALHIKDSEMTHDRNVLLITCEHGGNDVPEELASYFASRDAARQLHSHRGHDPGALFFAKALADQLNSPLEFSTVSRLVVDLNRSIDSAQLFSKFMSEQGKDLNTQVIESYYLPYRQRVTDLISQQVATGRSVLHWSVHTFTPLFRGRRRDFDIGVLFDPARERERQISDRLMDQLSSGGMRVLPNQPYQGVDDGFTTSLRQQYDDACYAGIELELNNRIDKRSEKRKSKWIDQIAEAIRISQG